MAQMTSGYGKIRVINGQQGIHHGEDYRAPIGTPIYTNQKMTIEKAGTANGYGNYIQARDEQGNLHTFGHLAEGGINVRKGDVVNPGDKIGWTGNTGRSTGPHLHYDVRNSSQASATNPQGYIDPNRVNPATGKRYNESVGFEPGKTLASSQAKVDVAFNTTERPRPPTSQPPTDTGYGYTGYESAVVPTPGGERDHSHSHDKTQQKPAGADPSRSNIASAGIRINPRHSLHDGSYPRPRT